MSRNARPSYFIDQLGDAAITFGIAIDGTHLHFARPEVVELLSRCQEFLQLTAPAGLPRPAMLEDEA